MTLALGSQALDFQLPATQGGNGLVTMDSLRGRPFLLSFYSMAFTPV